MSKRRMRPSGGADAWSRSVRDIWDEMLNRSFVEFRDGGSWQPAINLYESDTHYHVCVDLGGMERDGIDVQCLDARRLTIRGSRANRGPCGSAAPVRIVAMEINEGPFARQVELPGLVEVDRVEAGYDKGFLWISLPKAKTR